MNLCNARQPHRAVMLWIALLASTALLGGCFGGGPDKDEVRQILQQQIDDTGKVVVVSKIDHLNSAKQAHDWLVDVKATLTFKMSAEDMAKSLQNAPSEQGLSGMAGSLSQMGMVLKYGNFKAGDTRKISTRLKLIHGDQGWMPKDPG